MKKILFFVLILFIFNCSREDATFSILGKWIGLYWACNNASSCKVLEINKEATLTFTISSINESGFFTLPPSEYFLPSCDIDPNCSIIKGAWASDSATFINEQLYIRFKIQKDIDVKYSDSFIFTGSRFGDKFMGELEYEYYDGQDNFKKYSYLYNDQIEIIRAYQ